MFYLNVFFFDGLVTPWWRLFNTAVPIWSFYWCCQMWRRVGSIKYFGLPRKPELEPVNEKHWNLALRPVNIQSCSTIRPTNNGKNCFCQWKCIRRYCVTSAWGNYRKRTWLIRKSPDWYHNTECHNTIQHHSTSPPSPSHQILQQPVNLVAVFA